MLKVIKNLLQGNSLIFALLITIAIAVVSLVKLQIQQIDIDHADKYGHTIAYCVLTFFWIFHWQKTQKLTKALLLSGVASFFYGIILEILQGTLTSYRTISYYDVVANTIGILLAIAFFYFFRKKTSKKR